MSFVTIQSPLTSIVQQVHWLFKTSPTSKEYGRWAGRVVSGLEYSAYQNKRISGERQWGRFGHFNLSTWITHYSSHLPSQAEIASKQLENWSSEEEAQKLLRLLVEHWEWIKALRGENVSRQEMGQTSGSTDSIWAGVEGSLRQSRGKEVAENWENPEGVTEAKENKVLRRGGQLH